LKAGIAHTHIYETDNNFNGAEKQSEKSVPISSSSKKPLMIFQTAWAKISIMHRIIAGASFQIPGIPAAACAKAKENYFEN
jgi:hypothetical protein